MTDISSLDYKGVALAFATALAARDYPGALAMTSRQFQAVNTPETLRAAFEAIVPPDWGPVDPLELGLTMDSWPGREPDDVGWAYVVLGGDVYSEAVTVVVTRDEGQLRIRTVEYGRP
jgi:hypothetical protein